MRHRVVATLAATGFALAACGGGDPHPLAASQFQTTGDLLSALRTSGLCVAPVEFEEPVRPSSPGQTYARCNDGLVIAFFPPTQDNTIAVTFLYTQCQAFVLDDPMVYGMNWTIISRDLDKSKSDDQLRRAGQATGGVLTSVKAVLDDFCGGWE